MNVLRQTSWSPYVVGSLIGVLSWFAFATADKGLGITTAFEHSAAITERAVVPSLASEHSYYREHRGEKAPKIGWEWFLVVGVFLGSLASSKLSGDRSREGVPQLWRKRFGASVGRRFAGAFIGGAVMMLGARLAGGCTSGHGITGALQLAVSSWIFLPTFFLTGILFAAALYGWKGARHVRSAA